MTNISTPKLYSEYVTPNHPDKQTDRFAGALVDYAYQNEANPKTALEVQATSEGGTNNIIISILGEYQGNFKYEEDFLKATAQRIYGNADQFKFYNFLRQQSPEISKKVIGKEDVGAGDQGTIIASPHPIEHQISKYLSQKIFELYPYDGKTIISVDDKEFSVILNWSNIVTTDEIDKITEIINSVGEKFSRKVGEIKVNEFGDWFISGVFADSGAVNRKLVVDTQGFNLPIGGGGYHGKDLTKIDTSGYIYAKLLANEKKKTVKLIGNIGNPLLQVYFGDEFKEVKVQEVIDVAQEAIKQIGGFEKFAEWSL